MSLKASRILEINSICYIKINKKCIMKQLKISYLTSKIFRIFTFVIIGMATTLTVQAADVSFSGRTNTDWATASNWSTGTVPTSADEITIDARKSVTIANGATISVRRITLLEGASLTNNGTLTILPSTSTLGSALTVMGQCTFVNQGTLTVSSVNQSTASNTIAILGTANAFTFNGTTNLSAKIGVYIFTFAEAASASIGGTGFTVGSAAAPSLATVFGLGGLRSSLTVNSGTTITLYIGTDQKGFRLSGSTAFTNNGIVKIYPGSAVAGVTSFGIQLWNSANNLISTLTNNGTLTISGFERPMVFGLSSATTTGSQTFLNTGTANISTSDAPGTFGFFINKSFAFTFNNSGVLNLQSAYRSFQLFDNTLASQQINNVGTINITDGVVGSVAASASTYPTINNKSGGVINFNYGYPTGSKIATENVIINNNNGAQINGSCTFSASTLVTDAGSTLSPGDFAGGVSSIGFMILTPSAPGNKFPLNGNVSMQVNGVTTAGTDYDRINCPDIDVTNATMTVTTYQSFTPKIDDYVALIYAESSKTGTFSSTNLPNGWILQTSEKNEAIKFTGASAISELKVDYKITKSNGNLTVDFDNDFSAKVDLFDLRGNVIVSREIFSQFTLPVDTYKGVYIMRIASGNASTYIKLIFN